ncbi:MAG: ABC transporter substrate-binding protein [Elainella sp. C42_A2020_010]|nr:ABC transporter substrate-binding protein [Elainella sp. C42_A2020_010]
MNYQHSFFNPTSVNRRKFLKYGSLTLGSTILAACTNSQLATNISSAPASGKLDKITFGTSWYAQAEHGGFYQAVAKGIYQEHGLDVTIKMGGPQVNRTQLLMGGVTDFTMGYSADLLSSIESGIPVVGVAAIFQKDPQGLLAHPNQGIASLADLRGNPIFVSTIANTTFWPFLKAKYGFTDNQKRPYNFNPGPFLVDKQSAQQGYVTSEPYVIQQEGKFEPVVLLLADFGYQPYTSILQTRRVLVEKNPDLVQRFVDASIKGWYSYLNDPAPANALIKKDNPEMSDNLLTFGLSKLKQYEIVTGGDAKTMGIGAMTEARWRSFFDDMAKAGIYKTSTRYGDAFILDFTNKGASAYTSA